MHRVVKYPSCHVANAFFPSARRVYGCTLCCHCLQTHRLEPREVRHYSQYIAALNRLWKKKNKIKNGRFTDLMEVTDTNTRETKQAVRKLNAKSVTAFAEQPGMMLSGNWGKLSKTTRCMIHSDIRCYDPIVVLPVKNMLQFVDNLVLHNNVIIDQQIQPVGGLLPISVSSITNKTASNRNNVKPKTFASESKVQARSRIEFLDAVMTEELLFERSMQQGDGVEDGLRSVPVENVFSCQGLIDESDTITDGLHLQTSTVTDSKKKEKKNEKQVPGYPTILNKKTRENTAKQSTNTLELARMSENLHIHFLSYMVICSENGMLDDAFKTLKYYNGIIKDKMKVPKITQVNIYNVLLGGYAKEGNWQKVLELEAMIKEEGLSLDEQSFSAILYCLGKQLDNQGLTKKRFMHYLCEMERKDIQMNDLFTVTRLTQEQKDTVLGLIKTYYPSFEVEYKSLKMDADSALLKKLVEQQRPYTSPATDLLEVEELKRLTEEQLVMESKNYVEIRTIEKRFEPIETLQLYRTKLKNTEDKWRISVDEALVRSLNLLQVQARRRSLHYLSIYPYMKSLPRQDFVDIVMLEIRKLAEGSETYSPTTSQLYRDLGQKVYLRNRIQNKIKTGEYNKMKELLDRYSEWYLSPSGSSSNTRQQWQTLLRDYADCIHVDGKEKQWPNAVLQGIGKLLYNIILMDVKIDVNAMRTIGKQPEHHLPAFYTLFRSKGRITMEEVKPHPVLSRLYRAAAPEFLVFETCKIPMVCPPIPWSSITHGGYLVTETDLIRLPFNAASQWNVLKKTPVEQLYPALDSLNQLGSIPWVVNDEILDVVVQVFNDGGSSKLDVPESPGSLPIPDNVTPKMTQKERFQAYKERVAIRRRKAEMYSLWCDTLYKLSLANHFRGQMFWLPHNMDFRGRVYPVPPHLNHLGSDLSRSLLVFAKGKPLGPKGLDWLKVHIVNLTGTHKKSPVKDRLDHANIVLEDMLDSAEHPLTGRQWWTESDEPWQTLAACMELRKALASGDPENYVSQFPVHQDGSCNGLQHYAALGRDQAGAESVNLTPAECPQDVYNRVAQIVERERARDAAKGVEIARVLEGFVGRKVIKQTVMTTVYGVTRYGARLQIARQLKDLDGFPQEFIWPGSTYLVGKTFESLEEMFTSTKEIQEWFTECARLISLVCSESVEWVTPLGLPIVQPYCKLTKRSGQEHKFGKFSSCSVDTFERPNMMKQRNAFPPNFIHSLDSSHMMLTSLWCEHAATTFVSVHDCFWTHACTVDVMNRICRDQFVALHSQPILEDLSKHFVRRYSYTEHDVKDDGSIASCAKLGFNKVLRQLPKTGQFQLDNVLQSVYFFS